MLVLNKYLLNERINDSTQNAPSNNILWSQLKGFLKHVMTEKNSMWASSWLKTTFRDRLWLTDRWIKAKNSIAQMGTLFFIFFMSWIPVSPETSYSLGEV